MPDNSEKLARFYAERASVEALENYRLDLLSPTNAALDEALRRREAAAKAAGVRYVGECSACGRALYSGDLVHRSRFSTSTDCETCAPTHEMTLRQLKELAPSEVAKMFPDEAAWKAELDRLAKLPPKEKTLEPLK